MFKENMFIINMYRHTLYKPINLLCIITHLSEGGGASSMTRTSPFTRTSGRDTTTDRGICFRGSSGVVPFTPTRTRAVTALALECSWSRKECRHRQDPRTATSFVASSSCGSSLRTNARANCECRSCRRSSSSALMTCTPGVKVGGRGA